MLRPKRFNPNSTTNDSKKFNGRQHIDDMYDAAWEKYRGRFLAENKACYACGKEATGVDHLVPHIGDAKLFEQNDNHIPLCARCHNTITALFDRYHRKGKPITGKLNWIALSRTRNQIATRVMVLASYRVR